MTDTEAEDAQPEDREPGGPEPEAASDAGPETRAGFVAVIGASNAGKSTLINTAVGGKVSIVSRKVQTTRTRVLGIALHGQAQIIFVDTPGIFQPRRRLDRAMVAAAWAGAEDADLVLLLVDAHRPQPDPDTLGIIARLDGAGRAAILVLNKVDLVRRETLLGIAAALNEAGRFTDTFMISATTASGVDRLMNRLAALVPPSPWLFPEDQMSDMPMRLLAAEVTREQIYHQLHDELPYSATVETESWQERADGSVRIDQAITVMRESQKGIVLGERGRRIRAIGQAARQELEAMLEQRVHLFLFVRVREDWADRAEHYAALGLDYQA